MPSKKIICLGGGSFYFLRLLSDLVVREDLVGSEIVLYDIDEEKVEIMADLGRRLAQESGNDFTVRSTINRADAVDGADFAISSIGGSGAEVITDVFHSYYHTVDLYISAKYGIHQAIADTGGPGGMMMGLRSIPVYIEICREMEKRCPRVILFNHSNPMAILCRAMNKYTNIKVIGICHGVQESIAHIGSILELPAEELDCTWIGTNHYYWFTGVAHKGKDMFPQLMRRMAERKKQGNRSMNTLLSVAYGYKMGYPGDAHVLEFYSYMAQVRSQDELPYNAVHDAKAHGFDESKPMPSRQLVTPDVRAEFLKNYQDVLSKVKLLPKSEKHYVTDEGIPAMISAIAHCRREVFIVNLSNKGVIYNLPLTALVEVEGVTDSTGVRGVQMGECPYLLKGILEKRFVWQELVADAAVKGDRNLALQALLVDEMAIRPELAESMLDELLEASKDLLPRFFKKG